MSGILMFISLPSRRALCVRNLDVYQSSIQEGIVCQESCSSCTEHVVRLCVLMLCGLCVCVCVCVLVFVCIDAWLHRAFCVLVFVCVDAWLRRECCVLVHMHCCLAPETMLSVGTDLTG